MPTLGRDLTTVSGPYVGVVHGWTRRVQVMLDGHWQPWPAWDEALAAEDEVKIAVTVNGKPRGGLLISAAQADEAQVTSLALALPRVEAVTTGQTVRRVIYRPGKVLNLVVN